MGGIIGKFFHPFGITVTVAVLVSLFVSFTLDPMLSSAGPTTRRKTPGARMRDLPYGAPSLALIRAVDHGMDVLHAAATSGCIPGPSGRAARPSQLAVGGRASRRFGAGAGVGSEFVPQTDQGFHPAGDPP